MSDRRQKVTREHLTRSVELVPVGASHKIIIDALSKVAGCSKECARTWLRDDQAFRDALLRKQCDLSPSRHCHAVDDDARGRVVERVRGGADILTALVAEGLSQRDAKRWLASNPTFRAEVEAVNASLHARLVSVVERAASEGDTESARWLCDRLRGVVKGQDRPRQEGEAGLHRVLLAVVAHRGTMQSYG